VNSMRSVFLAPACAILGVLACAQTVHSNPQAPQQRICYQSDAGPMYFGSDVEEAPGPGWLVLDGYETPGPSLALSGPAEFFGNNWPKGQSHAYWQLTGDTVVVGVTLPLTVWEFRLLATELSASGMAAMTTDQVIGVGSDSGRHAVTRWAVWARAVECHTVGAT